MRTLTPYWTTRSLTSDLMSDFTTEIDKFMNEFNRATPAVTYDERNFAAPTTAKPRQIEIQSEKNSFFEKLLGSKKESNDMKEVNNG